MIKNEFKKDKVSKEIRQKLVEGCSQEDILSLEIDHGKNDIFFCDIKNRIIKGRNWLRINAFGKFEVPFMSVLITQKCTLRCKYCSDLMPYYENPQHFIYDKIIFYLNKYLSVVDQVHFLLLCGGETFLYPDLKKLLQYCIKEKKILKIGIVTNGTILPDSEMCKLLADPKVRVRVSDYKSVRKKRKEAVRYLKKCGVVVEDLSGQKWYDVGGFNKRGRSNRQLQELFHECAMNRCFEINQSRVIYCARQRSGEIGLTPEIPRQDYVSLKIKNRQILRQKLIEMYDKKFLATCDYCDGITRYSQEVIAGEQ